MSLKNRRRGKHVLTCLVATLALVGGMATPAVASPAPPTSADTLTDFDLEAFIGSQPNTRLGYDYLKLATALQGLVNRDKPQLYFHFRSSDVAKGRGFDTDQFWLDELTKPTSYLSSMTRVTASTFGTILDKFVGTSAGVVVWDDAVAATSNVASTAAGVENLLPVRFDPTPGSPYDELVVKRRVPVVLDLVGKFTGSGTIPDTAEPSTKSTKNDAYLWAKARYLDTGRTNPTLMTYALDAMPWPQAKAALDGQVISAALPEQLSVGQKVAVSVTLRNTGTLSWTASSLDRLGALDTNQILWSDLPGGHSESVTNQRAALGADVTVAPGDQATFGFTITAPAAPGRYSFAAGMVRDGVAWYPQGSLTRAIVVTAEAQPAVDPVDTPITTAGATAYPDLFNGALPNADYYIANRAFFFDLSPDATTVPNDDPTQVVGTDYATLTALLKAQNAKAGSNIITVGGFVPWWLKYTTHIDAGASMAPVASEWSFADTTSKYNAQVDADAYSLAGLSNASIFQNVPLNAALKQKNDKGQAPTPYAADTKYVTFYMGDYDSAAWTAGAMPALWNDPERGTLPLAWPLVPGLSARVPQVYNYLYDTMSAKDYFVAGDNGAGYLNPMQLLAENRPDGLPDFLDVWQSYNAALYDRFDLDITGFLISGNSGVVPERVQQSYSTFSPLGVGTNADYQSPVVNGTPFQTVMDVPSSDNATAYGEALARALADPAQFRTFRNVLATPTAVVNAVDYVRQTHPDLKFEVVDPYTNFRLYQEHTGWLVDVNPLVHPAAENKAAILVDGSVDPGEWEDAESVVVSPDSAAVRDGGTVWGAESNSADLTSTTSIKWDATNLYLLEQRKDDVVSFTETGAKMYLSDATMIFLDLDHGKAGRSYRDGDYAISVSPGGSDGKPHAFLREGHYSGAVERALPEATVKVTVSAAGYTMEVAIPWSTLDVTGFVPSAGARVGFTVMATDNDGAGNWGQIMWQGDGDDQQKWGDLVFEAAPTAPVNLSPPLITGKAKPKKVLLASPGKWDSAAAVFSYQWERDGVVIPGALTASYPVIEADAGHSLSVVVTATEEGRPAATATSAGISVK